jgi:hypothetical protein
MCGTPYPVYRTSAERPPPEGRLCGAPGAADAAGESVPAAVSRTMPVAAKVLVRVRRNKVPPHRASPHSSGERSP